MAGDGGTGVQSLARLSNLLGPGCGNAGAANSTTGNAGSPGEAESMRANQ